MDDLLKKQRVNTKAYLAIGLIGLMLMSAFYLIRVQDRGSDLSFQRACSVPERPIECTTIIARIAGTQIPLDEFDAYMTKRAGTHAVSVFTMQQKQVLLDELINRKRQIVQAYQAGLDRDPEIMAALERMMVTKLREQQLEPVLSAVEVTDGEIEQYYDRHRDQYTSLAMFRGAMIRFAASDAMAKKKRDLILAKANSVLSLAKTLAPSVRGFGALAVEHSAHQPSRYRGGDIGWFSSGKAGSVPAEVTNALLGLQHEGELAPLVTAEDGYYLVKLLEKRPARTHALATQSQKIWQTLLHRKREQAEKDWLASLQPAGQVDVNHSLLASLAPSGIAHTENQHAGPPGLPLPYRFMPNGG